MRAKLSEAERARQFLPFAALRGLEEELAAFAAAAPVLRERTEEEEAALSSALSRLSRGDRVDVCWLAGGTFSEATGTVREKCEPLRFLRLDGLKIPFDGITALTVLTQMPEK